MLAVGILCTMGMAALGTVFAGYNVYLGQIPDAATVASMEGPLDTNVYASDGTLIDVIPGGGKGNPYHIHDSLSQISKDAIDATIDIEDRHFYQESSLDVPRLVQAGLGYVSHSGTGGASTITEQLAKISFLQDNGSVSYKIKEIILGSEIASDFSKNQILEMYVNRIPYGNQSIGIGTAAEVYFHVPASKLDLAQSAMLAGLPQSPTTLDPLSNQNAAGVNPFAKQRQDAVLQAMVSNNDITQAQANAAAVEKLTFYGYWQYSPEAYMGSAWPASFLDYLENVYLPDNFGEAYTNPGGWNIDTTLNLADQALADATVHNQITPVANVDNMHDGALVSLDPETGGVLAMTGTANYQDPTFGQFNMAIETRQPGSTMKLFTYTALIASRQYTVVTPISNSTLNLNGYTPKNYNGTSGGYCKMEYCMGNSLNIPAVRAEYAVGVPTIANLAVDMGLYLYNGGVPVFPPADLYSFTLGSYQVSPLDLADAAATVADLGVQHNPAPIVDITAVSNGQVLYKYDAEAAARRVLPENVAFIMDMVTSNDAYRQPEFGSGDRLNLPGRPVSAKTGTSGSGYTSYDNWTVGWTPTILTCVWVGNPQGYQPQYALSNITSGLTGAAPIWQVYMEGATAGTPIVWYKTPSDVYQEGGSWFLPGTSPSTGTSICNPNCVTPTAAPTATPTAAPTAAPTPSG